MKHIALQVLVAAVDEGSLRGAAKRLGVTQPAVTKTLKELERDLQAPLLVRSSMGVMPTLQGQRLYERAKRVLLELTTARHEIAQLSGRMSGELSIGAVPVAVMLLMPEAMRTFCREFPEIQIRLREELYFEQLEQLRRGDVQVVVCGVPPGLSAGEFVIEPLMETRMVVVTRKKHGLRGVRSLRELSDLPWVYTGNSRDEGYARTLFELHGLKPPVQGAVVNSTLALMALVVQSNFVGLLPEQIAQHALVRQYIDVLPLKEEGLVLQVGAIVRRDIVVSPSVSHFIRHLHRAAHHVHRSGDSKK